MYNILRFELEVSSAEISPESTMYDFTKNKTDPNNTD